MTLALAFVVTSPVPLLLLEEKLEKAVAVTGRSTLPVPMKLENSASAAVSVSENDWVVIVGGMKCGSVIGNSEDQVPLGSVNCTKSTGCIAAPKICVVPLGPKNVTVGPTALGPVVCDVATESVVAVGVLGKINK